MFLLTLSRFRSSIKPGDGIFDLVDLGLVHLKLKLDCFFKMINLLIFYFRIYVSFHKILLFTNSKKKKKNTDFSK